MSSSRRSRQSVTGLWARLADDVKEFIDDEVVDRADAVEREVRRVGSRRSENLGRPPQRLEDSREIEELKGAVAELSQKVARLVEARASGHHQAAEAGVSADNADKTK